MRRRACQHLSYWLTSLKPARYSKTIENDNMEEYVSLTDLRIRKGQLKTHGPDGALSWLVAFANFLVNFIIVGLGRMSGILYVEFMYLFNIDRKTAAIPFSIQQAGRNLFGPVAGILGQKYGLRFVTIIGGVIGSISAGAAYYRLDITSLTILWGLLFGLSTALTTTLSQLSIDQYFDKHRATAGGFAFSGGCLGAFIFPIILETLIEKYQMRGTFLILGSIILYVVPAAILLVEPPWHKDSKLEPSVSKYGSIESGASTSQSEDSIEKIKANNRLTQSGEIKSLVTGIDFMALQENSDMVFQFLTMEMPGPVLKTTQPDLKNFNKKRLLNEMECIYASVVKTDKKSDSDSSGLITSSDGKIDSSGQDPIVRYRAHESTDSAHDALKFHHDIPRNVYIQNRLKELFEAKGLNLVSHFPYWEQPRAWKILVELRKLYETLKEDNEYLRTIYKKVEDFRARKPKAINIKRKKKINTTNSNSFFSHLNTAIKMHSNPIFLLICLCRGVFMLTFIPVVTVIVDFAMDQGLPKSDGKYIIATMSFGDLLGRLCLGWVTDRHCLSLPRYMLLVMLLLGASTASLPLMVTRATLFPAVLVFGILQGSLFVRHPLLVTQYTKKHEQAIGMGFINFLSGFLGFALPAFIGFFRDTIGSYNNMFYINGIICSAVGLIWILEPLFLQICTDITHNNRGKTSSSS